MGRRRSSKRGKFTDINELNYDPFENIEAELRLSRLVDEAEEELTQETIAQAVHPEVKIDALIDGTSVTAEQQLARRMLFGDGKLGRVGTLPPDRFRGEDLRVHQLGVDGPIRPDSVVVGGTTADMNSGVLNVHRNGVLTEYTGPKTEEILFSQWSQLNPG